MKCKVRVAFKKILVLCVYLIELRCNTEMLGLTSIYILGLCMRVIPLKQIILRSMKLV